MEIFVLCIDFQDTFFFHFCSLDLQKIHIIRVKSLVRYLTLTLFFMKNLEILSWKSKSKVQKHIFCIVPNTKIFVPVQIQMFLYLFEYKQFFVWAQVQILTVTLTLTLNPNHSWFLLKIGLVKYDGFFSFWLKLKSKYF